MNVPPVVLSVAGFDPSSGAGTTADIKTAAAHGCYAVTCITALTVQSTQGVFQVRPVEAEIVGRTLQALADDVEIAAVRLGMLGSGAVAGVVADFLQARALPNVVLDPLLRSSSGAALLDEPGCEVLRRRLLPLCHVATPNVDEAVELAGTGPGPIEGSWEEVFPRLQVMAARLRDLGCPAVVITGGHRAEANDYLSYREAGQLKEKIFPGQRLSSPSTHGTGCAFATALACQLAQGHRLPEAVQAAKDYVRRAIAAAYPLGKGIGPLNHAV
jgi:hydroxymethylpyrimidine/phosphomethylpyrimidine kinase